MSTTGPASGVLENVGPAGQVRRSADGSGSGDQIGSRPAHPPAGDEVLAERPEQEGGLPAIRTEDHVGPAGAMLIDRARTADLLVVGSRGRGAFRGLLLGSVALHCAMHALCPVMVVHAPRSRTAGGTRSEPALATH